MRSGELWCQQKKKRLNVHGTYSKDLLSKFAIMDWCCSTNYFCDLEISWKWILLSEYLKYNYLAVNFVFFLLFIVFIFDASPYLYFCWFKLMHLLVNWRGKQYFWILEHNKNIKLIFFMTKFYKEKLIWSGLNLFVQEKEKPIYFHDNNLK
jgi:hypothetical protein